MKSAAETAVTIQSGDLLLEGAWHDGDRPLAALILHPHPQYGGDMDNHVVMALTSTLAARGATTLRFNFRGTGRSQGSHDGGRGEVDDALAAAALLGRDRPGSPLVLAGYSFGAAVAAAASARMEPAALVLVSPPLAYAPLPPFAPHVRTLVIAGDRDPVAPADGVRKMASDRVTAEVVPGVDHGWWPGLDALNDRLGDFLDAAGIPNL
jgi:alpha/beta superfamily hydrolase